jgi:hypothetical protein
LLSFSAFPGYAFLRGLHPLPSHFYAVQGINLYEKSSPLKLLKSIYEYEKTTFTSDGG